MIKEGHYAEKHSVINRKKNTLQENIVFLFIRKVTVGNSNSHFFVYRYYFFSCSNSIRITSANLSGASNCGRCFTLEIYAVSIMEFCFA